LRQGLEMVEEVERFLKGEPLHHRIAPERWGLMA
jgi:hypothetical protein